MIPTEPKREYVQARRHVESLGVPTTALFMTMATRVVKACQRRRALDKNLRGVQLAREVSRAVVTDLGQRERVAICLENDRLRAMRLPTDPDMPTNPSVEDLCEYVVLYFARRIAAQEVGALDGIGDALARARREVFDSARPGLRGQGE